MKKHKSSTPKQHKASDKTAEVFVLTPDLLAKLGINLATLQQAPVTPPTPQPTSSRVKETEQSIEHSVSNNSIESEDASSIIETANLMKKSVFLSPTFFQTPTVSAPYEDEPIPIGNTTVEASSTSHHSNSQPYQFGRNKISEVNKSSEQSSSELVNNRNSSKEILVEPILLSADTTIQNEGKIFEKSAKTLVDDHADEAYLSDLSNSHSGCSPKSINSEVNKQKTQKNKTICDVDDDLHSNNTLVENKNVVDLPTVVVSAPVKKIKETKIIENRDCIYIAEAETGSDNIITMNQNSRDEFAVISNSENNLQSQSTFQADKPANINKNSKEDKVNIQVNPNLENVEATNIKSPNVSNILAKLNEEQFLATNKAVSYVATDLNSCKEMNIDHSLKKNTSVAEITNNSRDYVQEIAACHRKIANKRNDKVRRVSKNKDNEINVDQTISKICIQGVEKPGGLEIPEENWEITKVSKTYQKSIRCPNKRKMSQPEVIKISDSFQLTNDKNNRQGDGTVIKAVEHQNEFCICFDFGDLTYYDCEMLYEHIHFCLHNNIEYDSETLYSIYNEDEILKQSIDFVEDGSQDGPSNKQTDANTIQDRLCWNKININLDDNIDAKVGQTDAKLSLAKNVTSTLEIDKEKHIDNVITSETSKVAKPTQTRNRRSVSSETNNKNKSVEKSSRERKKDTSKSKDETLHMSNRSKDDGSLNALKKSSDRDIVDKSTKKREKSTNNSLNETPNSSTLDESPKALKQCNKNNEDCISKSIRAKSKNKSTDATPNAFNKVTDESSKGGKEFSNYRDIVDKSTKKKRDKSTSNSLNEIPYSSTKALDKSPKNNEDSISKSIRAKSKNKSTDATSNAFNKVTDESSKGGKELSNNTDIVDKSTKKRDKSTNNSLNETPNSSTKALDESPKNNVDCISKSIRAKSKNKSTDATPNAFNKVTDESSKGVKESSNTDIIDKSIKEREKSTKKLLCETPISSTKAIDKSSKALKKSNKTNQVSIKKYFTEKSRNKSTDVTPITCNKAEDESLKALKESSNTDIIDKSIKEGEKPTKKTLHETPNSSTRAIDESSKALKKANKKSKEGIEKYIKEREKSENTSAYVTPNACNKAIDESSEPRKETSKNRKDNLSCIDTPNISTKEIEEASKSRKRSLPKRKSSATTAADIDSTKNKKDEPLPIKKNNNSLNNDTDTVSDNDNIATPRSTRASSSRSSRLNPDDNEEQKSNKVILSKNASDFITESPQSSKKATETRTPSPTFSKCEKKKAPKSGKRSSNTTTIDPPAKKAKVVPSDITDDRKKPLRKRSERLSKAKNINDTVNQEESENFYRAETSTSDIQTIHNTSLSSCITKIEPENSDEEIMYEVSIISETTIDETQMTETNETADESEIIYEVSIISDTTMNESQPLDRDNSTMVDSRLLDTTFENTQPIECSTPSVQRSSESCKCAVCGTCMNKSQWDDHMWKEHNYLAWCEGDTPLDLDNDDQLRIHIQSISHQNGGLECSKCNLKRKHAKPFLRHIQACSVSEEDKTQDCTVESVQSENTGKPKKSRVKEALRPFTCAVCNESVERADWIEHIQEKHKYLAWTTDETPLDLEDETEVKEHLRNIAKYHGALKCNRCDSQWLYAKKFLDHKCVQQEVELSHGEVALELPGVVRCGACQLDVRGVDWVQHMQAAHEYMAWIEGQEPVDPDNPVQVKAHLDSIANAVGVLICARCGVRRTNAYGYLQHHNACVNSGFNVAMAITEPETPVGKDQYLCGVCHDSGPKSKWRDHAMSKHYNIAWRVGEVPINLRNPYAVEKYLKEYKKKRGLNCLSCNETRSSCYGFYAHILTCGRTPEEIEGVLNECEICHNKYLCVYRNQHMAAHRDSDMRREKRETMARVAEEEARNPPPREDPLLPMGKRKAAEKAKKVIEKHSSNMIDGKPVCGCGTIFQDAVEFAAHSCNRKVDDDGDESDNSIKMEGEEVASDDDEYAMMDSGVSDDEDLPRKRIRNKPVLDTKVQRLQYKIENNGYYLSEAYKDFVAAHYTGESLFNIWRNSPYTVVPAEERHKYLPELAESCKITIGKEEAEWTTYKRFEARKLVYSLFTGGAISCIAWAPPHLHDELSFYLAVCSHRGPDVPRHAAGEAPAHPGLLQIWCYDDFESAPYCALTLAHEYGIVWSLDWCPSGARDGPAPVVPHKCRVEATPARLGLLAVACSNGSVYILAVPVPPPRETDLEPPMYKLSPVAELRLTMTSERRVYQATSVKWSPQKGHSVIIVGYSDGTTALFDLNTESPFLAVMEGGATVYYPFQDRRAETSSITGVGVLSTTNAWFAVGGQFSTSMTGGTLAARTGRPSARSHAAASGAMPAVSWPAAALSGDLPFMRASSELEWWGSGRRLGAARAWAACARCARAASAAQAAVRLHHHHPVFTEIKKQIGALLVMTPLNKKKSKKKEHDDLSMVVEPLTYQDAAATYGLQLYTIPKKKSAQSLAHQICGKEEFMPERFPLADIVAMAFCPSDRHHDRLALATHTGFVFLIHA